MRKGFLLVVIGTALSVATLIWLGYRSIGQWQRSARLVAQQRAETAVDLLVTALLRDMRAAQSNALLSLNVDEPAENSASDLHAIVGAFARYPYPEVFFVKRPLNSAFTFYSRTVRHPEWIVDKSREQQSPVVFSEEPTVSQKLTFRIERDAEFGRRYSVFDTDVSGRLYQVIALVSYQDAFRERPGSIVGFMVDLQWVRSRYFQNVLTQITRIAGETSGVQLTILDEDDQRAAGAEADARADLPTARRTFPLLFVDPAIVAADLQEDLSVRSWTAHAVASGDSTLVSADAGARRTMALAAVAAVLMILALGVSIRAERAHVALTEMRSEFVSAVTHELRQPVAGIRAITEVLASGRLPTPEMTKEYATLAASESKRLTRLVDNLLAYSKVTDVGQVYSYEAVDLRTVIEECIHHFWPQLTGRFQQRIEVPEDLPRIRADRSAIDLMLSNVIDNAIRYSTDIKHLTMRAVNDATSGQILLEVSDRGPGIAADEIPHLTRKFFRGANAGFGGSGLGLAIANRIVTDHGGSLRIRSTVGEGTTVTIALPILGRSS